MKHNMENILIISSNQEWIQCIKNEIQCWDTSATITEIEDFNHVESKYSMTIIDDSIFPTYTKTSLIRIVRDVPKPMLMVFQVEPVTSVQFLKSIGIIPIEMKSVKNHLESLSEKKIKSQKDVQHPLKHFKTIFQSLSDGVILVDEKGDVVLQNEAADQMFETRSLPKEYVQELSSRLSTPVEIEIVRSNGQNGWGEAISTKVKWDEQDATLISIRDVTERHLENEIHKSEIEQLQVQDQQKKDFVSMASHELRAPIAVMREGVSLCLDEIVGEINEKQKEILTDSIQNIDRLERLVTDLLNISKIESGKIELRRCVIDVKLLIHKIIDDYEKLANEKEIHLELILPVQSVKIYTDRDKITQIVSNLMNNAMRFTEPKGEITVTLEDDDDFIKCSIQDTGPGIASENLPKLFKKFNQVGKATGQNYKGTGLGLAIVKGLVEKLGGEVGVESQLDVGSTFWFTLKKSTIPKVLILSDSKKRSGLIYNALEPLSFDRIETRDIKLASSLLASEKPSIIIENLTMNNNHNARFNALHQEAFRKRIPTLVMVEKLKETGVSTSSTGKRKLIKIDHDVTPEILRSKVLELLVEQR